MPKFWALLAPPELVVVQFKPTDYPAILHNARDYRK